MSSRTTTQNTLDIPGSGDTIDHDAMSSNVCDQFKAAVLAQAATFGLAAADTTPITNDKTRRGGLFIGTAALPDHSFCFPAARDWEDLLTRDPAAGLPSRAKISNSPRRRKTKRTRAWCLPL